MIRCSGCVRVSTARASGLRPARIVPSGLEPPHRFHGSDTEPTRRRREVNDRPGCRSPSLDRPGYRAVEAIREPSALNGSRHTKPPPPGRTCLPGRDVHDVDADGARAHENRRVPSGLNVRTTGARTASRTLRVPSSQVRTLHTFCSRRDVPDPDRAVAPAGREEPPVRAEGHLRGSRLAAPATCRPGYRRATAGGRRRTVRTSRPESRFHTWASPSPSPVARKDASSLRSTLKTSGNATSGPHGTCRGAGRQGSASRSEDPTPRPIRPDRRWRPRLPSGVNASGSDARSQDRGRVDRDGRRRRGGGPPPTSGIDGSVHARDRPERLEGEQDGELVDRPRGSPLPQQRARGAAARLDARCALRVPVEGDRRERSRDERGGGEHERPAPGVA